MSDEEIRSTYTNLLETKLSTLPFPNIDSCRENPQIMDKYLQSLCEAMLSSSQETIPTKQYHKHKHPGWNPALNAAHCRAKNAWHFWKRANKPTDPFHPAKSRYKMCKREFQKLLRKVARKQKFDFFRKLDVHASNSEKLFRLLRNYTNTHPDPTDKLTFEGNEYQGDNIDNGWAYFFESLSTASAASYSDPTPYHLNTDTLHDMDNSLLADFVTSEVEEAINSLASNKVSGPDNIMPEHLKYGGATLIFHLTQLFNLLVECKYVPQSLKHGNIIPIPKSKDKDPTDPSIVASLYSQQSANYGRSFLPGSEPMESLPKYIPCKEASAQGIVACTLHFFSKKRSLTCVSGRRYM